MSRKTEYGSGLGQLVLNLSLDLMGLGFNKLERIYIEKLMISCFRLQFLFELLTVYVE